MNKVLMMLLALSLSPVTHAMKRDASESKQEAKRLKSQERFEARSRMFVQKYAPPYALHNACKLAAAPDQKTVAMYVAAKANINLQDDYGYTPLHYLYRNFDPSNPFEEREERGLAIARMLLAYDASGINIQDNLGNTPLHLAARNGAVELVSIFLHYGADSNRTNNDGKSALHLAIQFEHDYKIRKNIVRQLLRYNADVNAQDGLGATPLHYAAFYGRCFDIMPLLIKAGAQYLYNVIGEGPLHYVFKEQLEPTDAQNWVVIANTYEATKNFDEIFAALLWAFPASARNFTPQDRDEAGVLLIQHSDAFNEPETSEVSNSPYFDSIDALNRAVEMMNDPVKQKEAVEATGEILRQKIIRSVCSRGSVTAALNNRAVTGKLKPGSKISLKEHEAFYE